MSVAFQIGLGRARVALLVAGFAWFFGLQTHVAVRATIGGLILAALIFDGVITDRTLADAVISAKPPPHDDYHTAA